jgi:hypothetical protein
LTGGNPRVAGRLRCGRCSSPWNVVGDRNATIVDATMTNVSIVTGDGHERGRS